MRSKTSKKERKRLFLISSTIIILLALLIASVYGDWKQILKNRQEEIELSQTYEYLLDNEEKLSAEITKLQNNDYLARYAKEKYMMSAEGDTIIKMN